MRLIFAGTPSIAADALRAITKEHEVALVITREDSPLGRKRVITPSPVAALAAELGIETVKTSRVGDQLEKIRGIEAELALVVAYGALIPQSALELLPWWNMHYSLLPKWRGATPLQHSMIHATGTGITIFQLEQGLDTGPVITAAPMEFAPQETAGEALVRFTDAGSQLLLEAIKNQPVPAAQVGEASLAPKISREQARVNFAEPADLIARKINALNPEPMAWAEFQGQPLRLLRAKELGVVNWQAIDSLGQPGALWLSENRVFLGCGRGTRLELLEIQPAGKKPMSARDFLRGQQQEVILD
jgi:methionyl-tRNA formyltransferase